MNNRRQNNLFAVVLELAQLAAGVFHHLWFTSMFKFLPDLGQKLTKIVAAVLLKNFK